VAIAYSLRENSTPTKAEVGDATALSAIENEAHHAFINDLRTRLL
jgi:hypothetical protein